MQFFYFYYNKNQTKDSFGEQDVDIEDQIRNAQFMYPDKPWKSISKEAIECIQHFLVVQHDARYTVDQALLDKWISEKQCLADIAKLEEEANITI